MTELAQSLDVPLFVVTAVSGTQRSGCAVGFLTQCSLEPERFLVCLSRANRTYVLARSAKALGVHLLGRDQQELAQLFGEQTDDQVDKLALCPWHPGASGAPILERCAAWAEMRILEQIPLGDHVGFLVEPTSSDRGGAEGVLHFSEAAPLAPGHPGDDPPR